MPSDEVTTADLRRFPARLRRGGRHRGWRGEEADRPFAAFFADDVAPPADHVRAALEAGPAPAGVGHEVDDVARRLSGSGDDALETGWTRTERGTFVVACRTDMPRVTAAMWDWWFGWHLPDTARYKLWHPAAHVGAAVAEDRSHARALTDRQRYVGNVSFVDEYIGCRLQRLAIRFVDAARFGFEDTPGTTHVCARVGLSELPIGIGWLVHQVRPTEGGAEMRSRFFLGHPELLRGVPARATSRPALAAVVGSRVARPVTARVMPVVAGRMVGAQLAADLLTHCAEEMQHLAGFLPELYEQFRDTP